MYTLLINSFLQIDWHVDLETNILWNSFIPFHISQLIKVGVFPDLCYKISFYNQYMLYQQINTMPTNGLITVLTLTHEETIFFTQYTFIYKKTAFKHFYL